VITSDSGGGGDRRAIVRALASEPTKTFAGLSQGGACMLCGETIKPDEVEYEFENAALTITVDVNCYETVAQEMAEARRAAEAAATAACIRVTG